MPRTIISYGSTACFSFHLIRCVVRNKQHIKERRNIKQKQEKNKRFAQVLANKIHNGSAITLLLLYIKKLYKGTVVVLFYFLFIF